MVELLKAIGRKVAVVSWRLDNQCKLSELRKSLYSSLYNEFVGVCLKIDTMVARRPHEFFHVLHTWAHMEKTHVVSLPSLDEHFRYYPTVESNKSSLSLELVYQSHLNEGLGACNACAHSHGHGP